MSKLAGAVRRRTRGDEREGERGSMLVEMVVTILLLGIVLAVVYEGIASLTGAAEGANTRLQNLDEARVIMATTTKDIRTATQPVASSSAIVSATANDLVFYANLDNVGAAASLVHLWVNPSTELIEELTPATNASGSASCASQPCSYLASKKHTRFVGRYVSNSPANPLFTYLDVNGNALTPGGSGLTSTQLLQVRSVRVLLGVSKTRSFHTGVTWVQNTVALSNVAYQQGT